MGRDIKRRYRIYTVSLPTLIAMMNWRQSLGVVMLPDLPELPEGYEVGAAAYDFERDTIMVRVHHESFTEVAVGVAADPIVPPLLMRGLAVPVPREATTTQSLVDAAVAADRKGAADHVRSLGGHGCEALADWILTRQG